MEVTTEYNSPYAKEAGLFYMDLGFAKRILKSKGRIQLYFTDLFNTLREKELTDYNNIHIDFYQKRPTRTVRLSFSYTFSSGRSFTKKKIDLSNSDEKSRMEN